MTKLYDDYLPSNRFAVVLCIYKTTDVTSLQNSAALRKSSQSSQSYEVATRKSPTARPRIGQTLVNPSTVALNVGATEGFTEATVGNYNLRMFQENLENLKKKNNFAI